ncbi:PDE7A, partial [Symbiodinium sp. CCMP2456]
ELHEELQVGKTKSVSRRWLVGTFTEGHELSASRRSSNISEVTPISPRSSLKVAASEEAHSERDENEADIEPTDTADIVVSLSGETEVAELLQGVGRLDFDVLAFAELPGIKGHMLEVLFQKAAQHHNLLEKLEDQSAVKEGLLFRSRLPKFLRTIEESYRSDVPYHTAVHASDAMMTMEWLLRSQSLLGQISAVDHLMALVSMAIHDVGHPG